jgi:ElaB/YqjD/DUF883 family membrane-anchored ribosome-binding protein
MNYESTVERSTEDLKQAARQTMHEMADVASDKASRLGNNVRDWFNRQSQVAKDAACTVRDEAVSLGNRTQQYARDEPAKTAFVVLAAGALIAGLVWLAIRERD